MLMTDQGVIIRFNVDSISQTSRATLGVKMIRVDDNAIVSSITKIIKTDDDIEEVETVESVDDEGMEENDDIIAENDSELEE